MWGLRDGERLKTAVEKREKENKARWTFCAFFRYRHVIFTKGKISALFNNDMQ